MKDSPEPNIEELKPDVRNANRGTERGREMLRESIRRFGMGRSILLDRNGNVIAGNKTLEAAKAEDIEALTVIETDGSRLIAVKRTDLSIDDARARELAIADNRTSETGLLWDEQEIQRLIDEGADLETFFPELYEAEPEAIEPENAEPKAAVNPEAIGKTLRERFLIPPFSVLDTRQGYWRERKRAWMETGIQSEEGRGKNLIYNVTSGVIDMYRNKKKYGDEPAPGRAGMQRGTSVFDPVLCEVAYRWFTGEGSRVLDPFAGGSVRGIVAEALGRHYTGFELREEQVNANNAQVLLMNRKPVWKLGDCRTLLPNLTPETFDFVFSCPPYYDLEKYSDDPADLSNAATYEQFLEGYAEVIAGALRALKPDRFACFVISDLRDKKGNYYGFTGDTIKLFRENGAELYNDAVLVTPAGSLPIRITGQFPGNRKLGKCHQNVLVFVKGRADEAVRACGDVEIEFPEGFMEAEEDAREPEI